MSAEVAEVFVPKSALANVDGIVEAVKAAIEERRSSIALDPSIATITLIVRLDRGPAPDVLFRTEARHK